MLCVVVWGVVVSGKGKSVGFSSLALISGKLAKGSKRVEGWFGWTSGLEDSE